MTPVRNIALRIEYDGSDFVGSQWQHNGRSVQGELEGAWEQLTQDRRRVTMAGRTDAGVHARGQVASIRTTTTRDLVTIRRGMNAILPEDVAVAEAWEVPYDFHARHSAVRRDYCYLIDTGDAPSPLLRRHALHVKRKLAAPAMAEAMAFLLGTHDFAAFAAGTPEGSTVRTCYVASCGMTKEFGRELVMIEVAANAFLQHMVRNIVGTLILVGEGRLLPRALPDILKSRDRRKAGPTAPAHGLYLMSVSYPPGDGRQNARNDRAEIIG